MLLSDQLIKNNIEIEAAREKHKNWQRKRNSSEETKMIAMNSKTHGCNVAFMPGGWKYPEKFEP